MLDEEAPLSYMQDPTQKKAMHASITSQTLLPFESLPRFRRGSVGLQLLKDSIYKALFGSLAVVQARGAPPTKRLERKPTGPKTIHFWAPTFKWGISIANVADFSKPPEKISYPQQVAVTCTGLIWSRYSTVITPKNWNLFSVNVVMAGTGIYQLARKTRHDYFSEVQEVPAKES
ncbi:hypothetical protein OPV22_002679 [Ensete ventricosum]|uniref:Mitochondrial pyruvate carrier n=1 Tax=Ensete ventricosum TaxID=4639 RepID=A0AAV8RYS4_ENSVE|nr:hypothetical protein OPV22_002679 [Ensete ventricosum]